MIVSPRRVEDPTLAMCSDPSPWLVMIAFDPVAQHLPVLFIVQMMHVGFVPTFETGEPFHDWVMLLDNFRAKNTCSVPLELCSHQRDHGVRISKAVGCTMDWHESATRGNVVQ